MKNAVIINLSPRKNGTSKILAKMCQEHLICKGKTADIIDFYSNLNDVDKVLKLIEKADTIVMSGPCYIDHFPADTIYLLEQMSVHPEIFHNQSMYGVIQGGMPYVHTHESGVKTLELFCEDCNITYKGSFVMGLGAMLNGQSLDKLINGKKVKKYFIIFLDHIVKDEFSPRLIYQKAQLKVPSFLYKYLSSKMNAKIDKELTDKGIDFLQQSPYAKMYN